MHEFKLKEEYIELVKLIKVLGLSQTGGHAKIMIENGEVIRNGNKEYRKRAKLKAGDKLDVNGILISIT